MRIFFVGDYRSDTGPGIANKMLKQGLKNDKNILFSVAYTKIGRVLEMIIKVFISDCVCFCSPSRANIIGINFAKLFNKQTFYIMHGYLTYENKINNMEITEEEIEDINKYEKTIFKNVTKVYCVSEKFMEYMKIAEPEYSEKFDYNYNGLDLDGIEKVAQQNKTGKNYNQIISLGGGMRIKNNIIVCQAIEKLNKERNMNLKYIVIGKSYSDKEIIEKFDFVDYYDDLSHDRVLQLMSKSNLYIQNSSLETFGLAVVEALYADCNILMSSNVGATGVMDSLTEKDLIFDTNSYEEIANKIENVLIIPNSKRLKCSISKNKIIYTESYKTLLKKITNNMERYCEGNKVR